MERREARRNSATVRRERTLARMREGERGVSEVVGTILILALVVVVMSAAILVVESRLPHATPAPANVVGLNITFQSSTANQQSGYLAGSFTYASGPILSIENFYFLVAVNGSSYIYNITSFAAAGNTWAEIEPGTQIYFDSSIMVATDNSIMPSIPQFANYTFDIMDKGNIIWSWSSSAVYNVKPMIANSWESMYNNSSISVYVATYGNVGSVVGDFSQMFGNQYASVAFMPTSSFGVWISSSTLPMPHKYGYYKITVTAATGNYAISGWFSLEGANLSAIFGQTFNVTFLAEPLTAGNWYLNITGPTGLIYSGPIAVGGGYWVFLPNGNYWYTASTGGNGNGKLSTVEGPFVVSGTNQTLIVSL